MISVATLEDLDDWVEQPVFFSDPLDVVRRFAHRPSIRGGYWLYALVHRDKMSRVDTVEFEAKFAGENGHGMIYLSNGATLEEVVTNLHEAVDAVTKLLVPN